MPDSVNQGSKKTGPPHGFGLSVNNYLSHYVNVADAKAAGILTADFTVAGFMLSKPPVTSFALICHWVALALLIASAISALLVVYPRKPHIGSSLIFWEGILSRGNFEAYHDELHDVNEAEVERQYAAQNYSLSTVLSKKYGFVRFSMTTLIVAIPLAMLRIVLG